jgi:hypothetical protein
MFRAIKSADDCKLLQSDIDSAHKWCLEHYVKINIVKISIISFTRKTNNNHFNYYTGDVLIVRIDYVEYSDVMLDSKLYFHCRVSYIY